MKILTISSSLLLLTMSTVSFAETKASCNTTLATNIQLAQDINKGNTEGCAKLGSLLVPFVAPNGACRDFFYAGELLLVPGGSTGVNKIACSALQKCNITLPDPLLCSGV